MAGLEKKYKPCLVSFMKYRDGVEYDKHHEFAQEELSEVTADDLCSYFNYRAYGTPTPTDDDRPTECRSNSLQYWKKAISYFMPNRNHQWDEVTNRGNPTKSQALIDMMKRVACFETRRQGAPSRARRPLREPEFRAIIGELHKRDDIIGKYGVPALLCFQFHMIGRIDDCSKFLRQNFYFHDNHPDKSLKARLAWSKNVYEERDAPWQHVFGCMDPTFCVFVNLGLFLEVFHASVADARDRPFVFAFTSEPDLDKAADIVKRKVYDVLRPILALIGLDQELAVAVINDLGSHSVRKFASTWARSNGVSKDDKDHRGRWRHKRISDDYDDVQLDSVDATVAAILCIGGVCHYVSVDDAVTGQWLAANVVPNIAAIFGIQVSKVLGKALLWLAYSDQKEWIPPDMLESITQAYEATRTIGDDEVPIVQRLVSVTGNANAVFMEDIVMQGPMAVNQPLTGATEPHIQYNAGNPGSDHQLLLALMSTANSLRQSINEQTQSIEGLRSNVRRNEQTMNRLVRRVDNNPIRLMQRAANNQAARQRDNPAASPPRRYVDNQRDARALLMDNPRNLHQLWDEYVNGIGNNKAAKYFTRAERGPCKFKYSRRKLFWDLVEKLIRRGQASADIIENIYQSYGPSLSVTAIINHIRENKRDGAWPPLLR